MVFHKVEEKKLKDAMDPTAVHVLKDKRFCLWKYLLETTDFPDLEVFELVVKGIPLYCTHTKPPNFPDDWKPSMVSVDELLQSAVGGLEKEGFDGLTELTAR